MATSEASPVRGLIAGFLVGSAGLGLLIEGVSIFIFGKVSSEAGRPLIALTYALAVWGILGVMSPSPAMVPAAQPRTTPWPDWGSRLHWGGSSALNAAGSTGSWFPLSPASSSASQRSPPWDSVGGSPDVTTRSRARSATRHT